METLLGMALTNAVLAALLALLAWLAGRALPGRPALAHGLWLLVLLKLITPPMVSVDLGWQRPTAAPPAETVAIREPEQMPTCVAFALPAEAPLGDAPLPTAEAQPEDAPAAPSDPAPRWQAWVLGGWLTGTAMIWALAGRRLWRLRRLLGELPAVPDEIQSEVRALAARLGLRRTPLTLFAPPGCGLPPLVFAVFGRARLVLPVDLWRALDESQRRTLLLHELAHLRRRDHWVRWLELVVLGLYWWHPVAWWAAARLRHAEELCCDAWVVWADPDHAADYAAALVETVAYLSCPRPRLPGVSAAGPVVDLERRLVMILNARTRRRLSLAGVAGLFVLGAALLPLAPTLAAPEPEKAATNNPGEDINLVIASLKSCQTCHEPAKRLTKKPGQEDDLHAEVIRLLNAVSVQKAALKKTQDELTRALEKFEKQHAPKKAELPKAKSEKPEDRMKELEKKLDLLLREVEALRKERKPAEKKDAPPSRLRNR